MHIQLFFFLHFYLFYSVLNSCNGKDVKRRVFLGRLLVALKRAGCVVCWCWKEQVSFSLADVQSDILLPSCMHTTTFYIDQQHRHFVICLPMCLMRCIKSLVLRTCVLYNVQYTRYCISHQILSSSSFLACNSRLRSAIRRHHPPQRAVLSQICCFGERKMVMFQILLNGAEPCDAGTTQLSSPVCRSGGQN